MKIIKNSCKTKKSLPLKGLQFLGLIDDGTSDDFMTNIADYILIPDEDNPDDNDKELLDRLLGCRGYLILINDIENYD
ncbi:MAG TPA: hypothetical protein V6C58_13805 [Allocoleopsis sp.]